MTPLVKSNVLYWYLTPIRSSYSICCLYCLFWYLVICCLALLLNCRMFRSPHPECKKVGNNHHILSFYTSQCIWHSTKDKAKVFNYWKAILCHFLYNQTQSLKEITKCVSFIFSIVASKCLAGGESPLFHLKLFIKY